MRDDTIIRIAAAVVVNENGRTLLVRKRGTTAFMQPGGKIVGGEAPLDTLARELIEEIGCSFDRGTARSLGVFSAPAANEQGCTVEAHLFRVSLSGNAEAASEIEEVRWVLPLMVGDLVLAPLTRDFVLSIACVGSRSTL
jgi:8-oxo-dGTP diphosphatase